MSSFRYVLHESARHNEMLHCNVIFKCPSIGNCLFSTNKTVQAQSGWEVTVHSFQVFARLSTFFPKQPWLPRLLNIYIIITYIYIYI